MNDSKFISESVLLRTLTKKSVLWFGKYNGLKVQQIMDLQNPGYLRWLYYNISGITFIDDVLEKLKINGKRKIQKPGIAPEMSDIVFHENTKNLHFFLQNHIEKVSRTRAKSKFVRTCKSVNFYKSQLQAINHGRM